MIRHDPIAIANAPHYASPSAEALGDGVQVPTNNEN